LPFDSFKGWFKLTFHMSLADQLQAASASAQLLPASYDNIRALLAASDNPLYRASITELATAGIQRIMIARFNRAMAEMSAPDFVTQLLVRQLNTRWLLVGEDFRFGRQRGGDIDLLRRLGRQHGMHVHGLGDITDARGSRISRGVYLRLG
jgi:riboflavin kinase/FMN adenylyltransferase